MASDSQSVRRTRVRSLIARISEMEGIDPSRPDEYTGESPEPLSIQQIELIEIVINQRAAVGRIMADSNGGKSIDEEDGNQSSSAEEGASSDPEDESLNQMAEGSESLSCNICGKDFKSKSTHLQHGREKHIGTKCYWPSCTFIASTEMELSRHLHIHQGGNGESCEWPKCGSSFAVKESLMRHIRRHIIKEKRAKKD
ncbi:uncharacterized protein GGS22DRAFT_185239 [Annulohypoxylon maeteangense]|uniref:uncharacterized protein n=1 Tax=Annulohypoxylon maeteangense TaxID=1927788 RepID=UPI002007CB8F|nr:uncharacterized protein GGS22DRAFT_185239 [Annulohypoxylon maeteangense]KAI0887859.1 hypothetical protein GGS22DRAFT_185239 [Annulohypoxylon maeteangense]